jgi:2-keto-3-deoxy-L-rhamnonate aldolase RhmA
LQRAIDKVVAAARKHNKYLGRPAGTASEAQQFHAQGFQLFQSVTELGLMERGAREFLDVLGPQSSSKDRSILY